MSMTATEEKSSAPAYQGTEKLLWGIVLAVVTFWLFAGTVGTVAPEILKDIKSMPPEVPCDPEGPVRQAKL